ncbi:MAG: High-affinity branched-chain amino acid transport system permease protein LivH, partial [uncultured Thermomicrobiales bacterium]
GRLRVRPATGQRPRPRLGLRPDRRRFGDGLRHPPPDQLRPRRGADARRLRRRLLRPGRLAFPPGRPPDGHCHGHHRRRHGADRLPAGPRGPRCRPPADLARRQHRPPERGAAGLRHPAQTLPDAARPRPADPPRRRRPGLRGEPPHHRRRPRPDGAADAVRHPDRPRHPDARRRRERDGRPPDGDQRQHRHRRRLRRRLRPGRGGRPPLRGAGWPRRVRDGLHPRPQGVRRHRHRRLRLHPWGSPRRLPARLRRDLPRLPAAGRPDQVPRRLRLRRPDPDPAAPAPGHPRLDRPGEDL